MIKFLLLDMPNFMKIHSPLRATCTLPYNPLLLTPRGTHINSIDPPCQFHTDRNSNTLLPDRNLLFLVITLIFALLPPPENLVAHVKSATTIIIQQIDVAGAMKIVHLHHRFKPTSLHIHHLYHLFNIRHIQDMYKQHHTTHGIRTQAFHTT